MAFQEFSGELDTVSPKESAQAFVPFDGKLDEKPGLIEDIGTGVSSTVKKVLGAWDKGAAAINESLPDWVPGKATPEENAVYRDRGAYLQQRGNEEAPQRWTGQVASGLSYAPFLASAPLVVGGTEGSARSQALQDMGVDSETANKAGLTAGALQGGIQLLPFGNVVFGAGAKQLAKSAAAAGGKSYVGGAVQQGVDEVYCQ